MKKLFSIIFGWLGVLTVLLAIGAYSEDSAHSPSIDATDELVVLSEEIAANLKTEPEIDPAFISVGSIDTINDNGAYYYRGTTSTNCSKIVVEATNSTSGLHDSYQLQNYSYGDSAYYYGIREDWDNLDEGLMNYEFTAYCDGEQVTTTDASYTYFKPWYQPSSSISESYTAPSYSSGNDYYINVDGDAIQSPTYYPSQPAGASAKCKDGTYSFSQHRSGTCSHHGGVSTWY